MPSIIFSATTAIAGPREAMMSAPRLVNADFIRAIRPEVVSPSSAMTPPIAFVAPAAPSEPSMMPFVNTSTASAAGTVPAETIFCISSVVTPNSLARILRPSTPPVANVFRASVVMFPCVIALPSAVAMEFKASSPLPVAAAASPSASTVAPALSASRPKAIRVLPASAHTSKLIGVPSLVSRSP